MNDGFHLINDTDGLKGNKSHMAIYIPLFNKN